MVRPFLCPGGLSGKCAHDIVTPANNREFSKRLFQTLIYLIQSIITLCVINVIIVIQGTDKQVNKHKKL